jgi:general secretion pathway protein D
LILRIIAYGLAATGCLLAADAVAARLAREARDAQNSGQLVRAYLLYAEAAARDPSNLSYRTNRDSLASAAHLLSQAHVETADISTDVKAAEKEAASEPPGTEPPVEFASEREWSREPDLQPIPTIQPTASTGSFDLRGDTKKLFEQVTGAYGVRALFDPELQPEKSVRFQIEGADFRTAMEALTAVTHTFLYPVSAHEIVVAQDTENKRAELEPVVLESFPLPNAVEQKDIIEAANAVRGVLNIKTIGWDSQNRVVLIRDRASRARAARGLLEAVLLPKAQVSLEVQFMTIDTDKNYHYGAALPTSFQLIDFGHVGAFQSILQSVTTAANFLAFGGGATLFGFGVTDATIFATYSNSVSQSFYDAMLTVGDGQTASLHVGDKYPIPQTLYTGAQLSSPSIYNPIGQFTEEDLGLVLKMSPRLNGNGDISIDVEADFKSLGTQTIDTVPEINERQFKGTVTLREGQLAVLAGMDASSFNVTRNGLLGLANIPGLDQILAENTRDTQTSHTLVVIKPTITRLPMSPYVSPQFLVGPVRGERVLL